MADTKDEAAEKEAEHFQEMTPVEVETEKYDPAPDLDAAIASRLTIAHLAGLSEKFARHLAEARKEHIVHIDTIATEALEAQKNYITELELQNERMGAALRRLRKAVETGSITELVDTIDRLQREKAALAHQILDLTKQKEPQQ